MNPLSNQEKAKLEREHQANSLLIAQYCEEEVGLLGQIAVGKPTASEFMDSQTTLILTLMTRLAFERAKVANLYDLREQTEK